MRDELLLEPKYIREYIVYLLETLKRNNHSIEEGVFHHNTTYDALPLIAKNGILSLLEQQKKGLVSYSKEDLERLSDISSHINGVDGISLSKTDTEDAYPDEDIYDPYKEKYVDIVLIGVQAFHRRNHYTNEYIYLDSISPRKFLSFDIRLMKLIENTRNIEDLERIKEIVIAINSLKETAVTIKGEKLFLPIREMSYEKDSVNGLCLDIDKMAEMPLINIKKR